MSRSPERASPAPGRHGFAERIIKWQRVHGRHDLPWQEREAGEAEDAGGPDSGQREQRAYRVWLSEIMLQQTQVATVIPYYLRFLERFPSLQSLADAPLDDVLRLWSGLGYYSRARNLHAAARRTISEFGGAFPRTVDELRSLPGIGRSTAGAIAALAFGVRAPILDANVRRVLRRVFGDDGGFDSHRPGSAEKRLWEIADELLPEAGIEAYTQGLMDLGAMLCTPRSPRCEICPIADRCAARQRGEVIGVSATVPTQKRKSPRPERSVAMLLMRHGERIWLHRRPPAGIWGGLLSLPELPTEGAAIAARRLADEHGRVTRVEPLARFSHVFTHFKLHVEVFQATLSDPRGASPAVNDPAADGVWLELSDAPGAALPSPVKKLLADLASAPVDGYAQRHLPLEIAGEAIEARAAASEHYRRPFQP